MAFGLAPLITSNGIGNIKRLGNLANNITKLPNFLNFTNLAKKAND